jgi:hypothetical protein
MGCGEMYRAKRPHVCDPAKVKSGDSRSEPSRAKSAKLTFGKGKR